MELKGKIAVITGASRGLGKELARSFVKHGAHVVLSARDKAELDAACHEIGGGVVYVADVTKEQEMRDLAKYTLDSFGKIDAWINNAGTYAVFPKEDLLDMEKAHALFDLNLFGTVFGCRTAKMHLEKGGAIVNILSSAALDASRGGSAKLYTASKWAVRGFTDAFRAENKNKGFSVISVYPSGMKTGFHDSAQHKDFANFLDPKDVAEKILKNLEASKPEEELIIKR